MGQARNLQNRIQRLHLTTRIDHLRGEDRQFNASLDIGGLFDTHPGATYGTGEQDIGLALKAGLGYQFPLDGKLGFRVDYSGYADYYRDLSEFDLQDHQVSIEPQYISDQLVCSLQLGGGRRFENGQHDADRIIISPAVTRLLDSGSKAIAVYGHAAKIEDKNTARVLNEDRKTLGAGISYFFTPGENGSALISLEYAKADYEAFVSDYDPEVESNDRRNDRALVASLDFLSRITPHLGFYAGYSYIHNRSNMFLFDYQRHILEGGISLFY